MVWWSVGWAIAYGGKTESGTFNQFLGPGSFFTRGEGFADETGNYGTVEGYNWALWLFQVCVCGCVKTALLPDIDIVFQSKHDNFCQPDSQSFGVQAHGCYRVSQLLPDTAAGRELPATAHP